MAARALVNTIGYNNNASGNDWSTHSHFEWLSNKAKMAIELRVMPKCRWVIKQPLCQ